jgi:hypothetical protein
MYLTLHGVLQETMRVHGSNKYNLTHMKKGTLERQGSLPLQVHCETTLVNGAMEKLAAWNN